MERRRMVDAWRAGLILLVASLLAFSGCGWVGGGPSDNERRIKATENTATALKSQGVKAEEKHFPQGDAWSVNLSGMTISEDLLKQVRKLGNICDIDLSKTNFGDEHISLFNELGMGVLCLKLNFSGTALTDAGFEKLNNLRFLSEMDLTGTKVTPAAVERFRKARKADSRVPAIFKAPKIKLG